MAGDKQIVISASRRTDIPAFYLEWFMDRIARGSFEVPNPYNRKISVVPATADKVHTIVFWSKDFGPFLESGIGDRLLRRGYHLFFNFTVNSEAPLLEPGVPPLADRLRQLASLSRRFDPRVIHWRFDPICFFRTANGALRHNLAQLDRISDVAARAGVERCITSFVDLYAKVRKRVARLPGMRFEDPPMERKMATVSDMQALLASKGISLALCCENEVLESLPPESHIGRSSCIPNHLLKAVYGGAPALRKDSGQRVKQGCGCSISSDIGSYKEHPCYHNCLFCYANPS